MKKFSESVTFLEFLNSNPCEFEVAILLCSKFFEIVALVARLIDISEVLEAVLLVSTLLVMLNTPILTASSYPKLNIVFKLNRL
jgi:hypothetical protein